MLASECGAVSVVDVLLQRGADLSAVDSQGHDVGHYANMSGKPDVAAALKKQQIPGTGHANTQRVQTHFETVMGLVASTGQAEYCSTSHPAGNLKILHE